MSQYTIVGAGGEIINGIDVPDGEHLALNTPQGATAIKGFPADWQSYYAAGAWVSKGAQPSPVYVWNAATKLWTDPRTLAQQQDDKWNQIKASRDAVIDAPLVTPYGTFDSYADARANIADAVLLSRTSTDMGSPINIVFTLADNTTVTLNLTAMETVGLMLGAKVQTARGTGTTLRTQIYATTDSTTLNAITWPVT